MHLQTDMAGLGAAHTWRSTSGLVVNPLVSLTERPPAAHWPVSDTSTLPVSPGITKRPAQRMPLERRNGARTIGPVATRVTGRRIPLSQLTRPSSSRPTDVSRPPCGVRPCRASDSSSSRTPDSCPWPSDDHSSRWPRRRSLACPYISRSTRCTSGPSIHLPSMGPAPSPDGSASPYPPSRPAFGSNTAHPRERDRLNDRPGSLPAWLSLGVVDHGVSRACSSPTPARWSSSAWTTLMDPGCAPSRRAWRPPLSAPCCGTSSWAELAPVRRDHSLGVGWPSG